MRLTQKIESEMADKFEATFDFIPALDKVPFHVKREAALAAARVAFEQIRLAS